MLKEKNHEHCHTTSNDMWSGDVVTYKISERETGRGTKKYGEINAERHPERQDQDKIRNEVVRSKTQVKDIVKKYIT